MKNVITMRAPVTITNLRNGFVRIEAAKRRGKRPGIRSPFEELRGRPRLHIRTDEFMKLLNSVPTNFGAL